MPELPDIALYLARLEERLEGERLERVRIASPFLVRSVDPPIAAVEGRQLVGLRRLGKRIVIELEGELFLVLHLMIAGRLRWRERGAAIPARIGLAAFDFAGGSLLLTEAGTKRRARLHVVRGEAGLAEHDPGGLEPLEASPAEFAQALKKENHTLKRALTDPGLFSGIGNAYSDEILHAARLSPLQWTRNLEDVEVERLRTAAQATLKAWIERLRAEKPGAWPEKVTAFREGMAVHGRYGKPCPECGTPVQRIRYAENECNYCPTCQTGGKLLADRALSRLMKKDWPRSVEELERLKAERREERSE